MNGFDTGDDDMATCEYCHKRYDIQVGPPGHICDEMLKVQAKESKEWDKAFKGKGKVKGKLVIEYECFDSEEAFDNLMDMISLDGALEKGEHSGSDELMGCKWKTSHKRIR